MGKTAIAAAAAKPKIACLTLIMARSFIRGLSMASTVLSILMQRNRTVPFCPKTHSRGLFARASTVRLHSPDEFQARCLWERQSLIFAPMGKK
jgi:hypothetical protein